MAKTKISTLAKELNVALPTVFSFLSEKGVSVEESPNTRVEDDVVELLVSKFKPDKDLKKKSDQLGAARRPAAPAPKPAEPVQEIKITPEPVAKPRVVGHINLDSKGNPVAKKEAPAPAKVANPSSEKTEKAPEKKVEGKKAEEKPVKKETPAPAPVEQKEAKPAEPKAEKQAEPEVFSPSTPTANVNLKIVGSIDLDAINQTTRPKKKGKENRPGKAEGGDRKKRRRIGKDKVDIEKAGKAVSEASESRDRRGGGNDRDRRGADKQASRGKDRGKQGRNKPAPTPVVT